MAQSLKNLTRLFSLVVCTFKDYTWSMYRSIILLLQNLGVLHPKHLLVYGLALMIMVLHCINPHLGTISLFDSYDCSLQNSHSYCSCSHPFSVGMLWLVDLPLWDTMRWETAQLHYYQRSAMLGPGETMLHHSVIRGECAHFDVASYVQFIGHGRQIRKGIFRCQGVQP